MSVSEMLKDLYRLTMLKNHKLALFTSHIFSRPEPPDVLWHNPVVCWLNHKKVVGAQIPIFVMKLITTVHTCFTDKTMFTSYHNISQFWMAIRNISQLWLNMSLHIAIVRTVQYYVYISKYHSYGLLWLIHINLLLTSWQVYIYLWLITNLWLISLQLPL